LLLISHIFIIIIYCHLLLGLANISFPIGVPITILNAFLWFPSLIHDRSSLNFIALISINVFYKSQRKKCSSFCIC
jgi:hypothetical protein